MPLERSSTAADDPATRRMSLQQALGPQLLLLGFVIVVNAASRLGWLPPMSQLSSRLSDLFAQHGVPLVVVASFLENLAGVGTYFPGSVVLVGAMAVAAGNPQLALITYAAVLIPAIAANYHFRFLGF